MLPPASWPDPEWFRRIGRPAGSPGTVLWLPHAGGGLAPLVRTAFQSEMPFEVFGLKMPGREDRVGSPPIECLTTLVEQVDRALGPSPPPIVLAGHSFGALVAYRLARRLIARDCPPLGLVVMAMAAPCQLGGRPRSGHLDDDAFAEHLDRKFGGIPDAIRNHREALQYFLPIVRRDVQMLESFEHGGEPPMHPPILALAGVDDRAADQVAMARWRDHTLADFTLQLFSGGHFFPFQNWRRLLSAIQTHFPALSASP